MYTKLYIIIVVADGLANFKLPPTFATTVVTDIGNYQVDYNENHIRYIYNLFVLLINKLTNKPWLVVVYIFISSISASW